MKWHVYARVVFNDDTLSDWHWEPRQYKSKSAAFRALKMLKMLRWLRCRDAEDGNEMWRSKGVKDIQYFAVPETMKPRRDTVLKELP